MFNQHLAGQDLSLNEAQEVVGVLDFFRWRANDVIWEEISERRKRGEKRVQLRDFVDAIWRRLASTHLAMRPAMSLLPAISTQRDEVSDEVN